MQLSEGGLGCIVTPLKLHWLHSRYSSSVITLGSWGGVQRAAPHTHE